MGWFSLNQNFSFGAKMVGNPETPGINSDTPENPDIPDVKSGYSGFLQYYRRRVISN